MINLEIVSSLISNQFPKWKDLEIRPVEKSGHDNRSFHLGDDMIIRLPSAKAYVPQVEKEYKWLPFLSQFLSLPISSPIAKGQPDENYPFPWLVNRYIKGETLSAHNMKSKNSFARELSQFLLDLQKINTENAPVAGAHNFYRGGDLAVYHDETVKALESLKGMLPTDRLLEIWKKGLASKWEKTPVWIHGDVAPGNLLVDKGHLCAVIDFGIMGIGDPSCDYAMAWTFFDSQSREFFLKNIDKFTVDRAKAWALWKALITYDADENSKRTINEILSEEETK